MKIVKISAKGKITIPKDVREALGIKSGVNIAIVKENGRYYLENINVAVMEEAQEAFKGAAEKAGFNNEEEFMEWFQEFRKEFFEEWKKEQEEKSKANEETKDDDSSEE